VLVGDQLEYSDDVCGVVLSVRFNEDILSVWNRNASDHQVCNCICCSIVHRYDVKTVTHSCSCVVQAVMTLRDSIKRHLKLPHSYLMEYKPHDASRRDNSSYRNTWLRG
jgi:translation initiation factor 4E